MTTSRRPGVRWVLAAAVIAALAGCARIDAHLTIDGDTVSGTVILALDRQAAARLEIAPDQVFADQHRELTSLDRVTSSAYDDGTSVGREYTFDRVLLADVNRMSQDDPGGLRITRDVAAGTYALAMIVDLTWLTDFEERQDAGPGTSQLVDRVDVRVAVTFPGEVVEHNGDLAGSTVTWRPPPRQRTELVAVAYAPDEPAAGGQRQDGDRDLLAVVLLVGVGALVLAAAGLGVSWLAGRRQPRAEPADTRWDLRPPSAATLPGDEPTHPLP